MRYSPRLCLVSKILICLAALSVQGLHAGTKFLMYRYSSYGGPYPERKILISNEAGLGVSFLKGPVQYGYGLFCGYVLPNKINPLANIGADYLLSSDFHEYYAGAKIEAHLFYKLYFERNDNPYVYERRSWLGARLYPNMGMNLYKKVKLEGQLSYPFHFFSIGIGYGY